MESYRAKVIASNLFKSIHSCSILFDFPSGLGFTLEKEVIPATAILQRMSLVHFMPLHLCNNLVSQSLFSQGSFYTSSFGEEQSDVKKA